MSGHNDNDICRMCIKSMKMMIPQDVRSNLGGGEASRPHVISLTCHGVLTDYNSNLRCTGHVSRRVPRPAFCVLAGHPAPDDPRPDPTRLAPW